MKKIIIFLLSFSMVLSIMPISAHALGAEPSVSAQSAVLLDVDSQNVLYEKNKDKRMGMASTTKIMTALVAIENCDLQKKVVISSEAVGIEGSSVYLYAGECFTLEELLYALLLRSANDAAVAIAIAVGGSVQGFVDMMNDTAQKLGLKDTHFDNPHGLHSNGHYTTAYELAVISCRAIKNETLQKIASTKKTTIPFDGGPNERFLVNHNKMLKLYEGAIGLKTGFTKATGRCLVGAAERDGMRLVSVTLDAPDDWNDHTKMLDHGFDNYESFLIADVSSFTYQLPLVGGKNSYVTLTNTAELRITLPKERGEIACRIDTYHRFEFSPVYRGTHMGYVTYSYDGRFFASSELVCASFAH